MRSFSPRPCATTAALTTAPATGGRPMLTPAPSPTIRTWSRTTSAPTSAGSCSTLSFSPGATLYCLPPVLTTAYMNDSSVLAVCFVAVRVGPAIGPVAAERYFGKPLIISDFQGHGHSTRQPRSDLAEEHSG